MRLQTPKTPLIFTGICATCAAIAGVAQLNLNLQSTRAEGDRSGSLKVVTQHVIMDSCWEVEGTLKIGNQIDLAGGKAPTSCFTNGRQYGYAAYLDGSLQIVRVFSPKEIQAEKSNLLTPKKK